MGTWRITIDGTGCHHNNKPEIDADLATAAFVKQLQAMGIRVEAARFEMRGAYIDEVYNADAVDVTAPLNIDFLKP